MNVRVSLSPAPLAPSAALEPVPAVLIRRAAVSLHHAIDGDLRLGRQLHGRGSLLVALITVPYDRAPMPNSSVMALWSSKQQRSGSARLTLALDAVDADRDLL